MREPVSIFDAIEKDCEEKCPCYDCSYYDLNVISIFPFEHCYKHNWDNKEPCKFYKCEYYTTSKWIRLQTRIKSLINIFR